MMKHYFSVWFFWTIFSNFATAQNKIEISYVSAHLGDNITTLWLRDISSKARLGLGINTHINQPLRYNGNNGFFKAGYAHNLKQRFGLVGSFQYKIKPSSWKLTPYIGYRTQLSYKSTRTITYAPLIDLNDSSQIIGPRGKDFYVRYDGENFLPPNTLLIEQYLTLNIESQITENFNLNLTAGGGATYLSFFNYFELAPYASIGVSYNFGRKKTSKK